MSFIALVPLRYAGPYNFVNIFMRRSLILLFLFYLLSFASVFAINFSEKTMNLS